MGKLLKQAVGLTVLFILLGFSNGIYAQKAITGVVKDAANGGTLPGVNVTVKEKAGVGTVTDIDGKFSLKLPEGAKTLVFSFIGYTSQDVAIAGKTSIEVQLQADARKLDEVVVTALGIKRQTKALGYAVTEVKGAELAQANTVSPVSALQGKVAGVSIGSSDGGMFGGSKISIRGVSTLAGKNRPIFVIDGVILDNNTSGESEWSTTANDWGNELKNLNADDFESVSVLKGSAATALYGSRGLFGAVVITTKNAKSNKGLGVSVSQTFGIDYVYKTPDLQNEFGPGTLAGYVANQTENGSPVNRFDVNQFFYRDVNGTKIRSIADLNGELSWGPRFDGKPIYGYDHQMTSYQAYKNNMKQAYELGLNTNTNVTVTGGNDKTKFLLSDSYNYRKGNYIGNTFEKNSLLMKANHKLTDRIDLEGSMSFTLSNPKNPANGDTGNMFLDGSIPRSYNTNKFKDMYTAAHGGIPNNEYNDELGDMPGTSYWFALNNNKYERKEKSIIPIVKLSFDATDWMKVILEGNMNLYSYTSSVKELGGGYMNAGGKYSVGDYSKNQKTGKASVNLHKNVKDFAFSLIAGAETFNTYETSSSVSTAGGLIVPGNYSLSNSKENLEGKGNARFNEKTISSLYYLFNASWKDQIYLDITGRNDWSSALVYADGSGNYSYFYPSISTSWIASQSFNMPEWVSFAKLRLSWAQVGNDTNPYFVNDGYTLEKLQQGSGFIYRNGLQSTVKNLGLKPERKNSFEIGTDIRLFKNRLGIDLTLYKENTRDQIVDIQVPQESGANFMTVNAGNIQNKGIELSLKTVPIKTDDFEWDFDFNYSKNQNKIVSLHESVGDYKRLEGDPTYGNYRVGSVAWIGGEYGVLLSDILPKKYVSVDASDKSLNGMNVLTWSNANRGAIVQRSNEVQKIGSTLPKFEGSFNNTFKYKGLSLNVLIDMRYGGYLTSYSNRYGTGYGFLESSLKYRDEAHGGITWTSKYDGVTYHDGVIPEGVFAKGTKFDTPAGTSVTIDKAMSYKDAVTAGYIEPTHASWWHYRLNSWGQGVVTDTWVSEIKYIALRQLSLGYNVPSKLAKRLGVKGMFVSLDGRNLCYLYNSLPNHLNPESTRGNSSSYSYFERSFSPYIATYAFTVKFNF